MLIGHNKTVTRFRQSILRIAVLSAALITASCSEEEIKNKGRELKQAVKEKISDGQASAVKKLGVAPSYKGKLESLKQINVREAQLERILPPMKYPWAFEFINGNEILLTEISGKLYHINLETKEKTEISGLPLVGSGFQQMGLLDIELHPDFEQNKRIYLSFVEPDKDTKKYHRTEVVTATLDGNTLKDKKNLIQDHMFGWAPSNFGGALEFDDKGYLYITIGDRGEEPSSQVGNRMEGKVLRLHDDGRVPEDNPFVGQESYDPRVYAMGVRNAQGLHFDKKTGLMFESEHGPLGGDEVNIIKSGADYGWPTISYGANYSSARPVGIGTHKDGLEQPIFYFLPSIAASRLEVYRGEMFPEWDGDIFVTALRGQHVAKLDYNEGIIRSSFGILQEVGGRIRDIKVAPDGSLYILSQTSGLHRLFRDVPPPKPQPIARLKKTADTPPVKRPAPYTGPIEEHPGKNYYNLVCSGCHNIGAGGAPKLGDYEAWKPIMEQPWETTRDRVLNGYNGMPERGFCYVCSDFGLMQMVEYMFDKAKENE